THIAFEIEGRRLRQSIRNRRSLWCLVPCSGANGLPHIETPHQRAHPERAALDHAESKCRVTFEHTPEHHRDQQIFIRRPPRSEERRVGKECRSRWSPY